MSPNTTSYFGQPTYYRKKGIKKPELIKITKKKIKK